LTRFDRRNCTDAPPRPTFIDETARTRRHDPPSIDESVRIFGSDPPPIDDAGHPRGFDADLIDETGRARRLDRLRSTKLGGRAVLTRFHRRIRSNLWI